MEPKTLHFDEKSYDYSLQNLKTIIAETAIVSREWAAIHRETQLIPELTPERFSNWMDEPLLISSIADAEAKKRLDKVLWQGANLMIPLKPVTLLLSDPGQTGRRLVSLQTRQSQSLYPHFFSWQWVDFVNSAPVIAKGTEGILKAKCTIFEDESSLKWISSLKSMVDLANEHVGSITNEYVLYDSEGKASIDFSKLLFRIKQSDPDYVPKQHFSGMPTGGIYVPKPGPAKVPKDFTV